MLPYFFFICFFIVRDVYITQEGEPKRRESILRTEPKTREEPRTREEPKTREDFMKCESLLYFMHKHEFNCCETSSRNVSNPSPVILSLFCDNKLKVRGVIVTYSTGILGFIHRVLTTHSRNKCDKSFAAYRTGLVNSEKTNVQFGIT